MSVHSFFKCLFSIFLKCIGCHSYDRNTGFFLIFQPSDCLSCLIAIHVRHLDIHKDQIVGPCRFLFHPCHTLNSILNTVNHKFHILQDKLCDFRIQVIILSQQNIFSADPVCFLCIRGRIRNLLVVTLISNPVFHDNCKFASFSQLTFCFNGSAHHINIFLYDRHSQTCSCNLCGCCIAFPGKSLKQGWQEFFTHSNTGINYLSLYPHIVFPVTVKLCNPYGNCSP